MEVPKQKKVFLMKDKILTMCKGGRVKALLSLTIAEAVISIYELLTDFTPGALIGFLISAAFTIWLIVNFRCIIKGPEWQGLKGMASYMRLICVLMWIAVSLLALAMLIGIIGSTKNIENGAGVSLISTLLLIAPYLVVAVLQLISAKKVSLAVSDLVDNRLSDESFRIGKMPEVTAMILVVLASLMLVGIPVLSWVLVATESQVPIGTVLRAYLTSGPLLMSLISIGCSLATLIITYTVFREIRIASEQTHAIEESNE